MSRITQQTWDQIVTQLLTAAGLVITIGNQAGWWSIGSDLQQNIIGLGTVILGLAAGLIYSLNATPNRQVDKMVALAASNAYDDGHLVGVRFGRQQRPIPDDSLETFPVHETTQVPSASVDPRVYKGGL